MASNTPQTARRIGVFFRDLRDRRRGTQGLEFPLVDLVVMAIVAVIGGAEDWDGIAVFVQAHATWFRRHLNPELTRMPSASTFRDVLTCLRPNEWHPCVERFATALAGEKAPREHQALDGKALRGSWKSGLGPLKLLHAYSVTKDLLTAFEVQRDGSELPAIMALLERLDVAGTVTSIDAAGAAKTVARRIVRKGGDYHVRIKANQQTLYEAIADRMLAVSRGEEDPAVRKVERVEVSRGRVEERTLWVAPAAEVPAALAWPGAQSVGVQRRVVVQNGQRKEGWRYFVSSLSPEDVEGHRTILRSHWHIENKLHWRLDVVFREDASRLRTERSQLFFAMLRRLGLSILSKAPPPSPTRRNSLRRARQMAGWSEAYLEIVLASVSPS
jgi:predicted transposase YbfD/YdcC